MSIDSNFDVTIPASQQFTGAHLFECSYQTILLSLDLTDVHIFCLKVFILAKRQGRGV